MKSAFEGLIGRSDTAEERISKLENMSIETPKTEKQREKTTLKMEQNIQWLRNNYKKCKICAMGRPEREGGKREEARKESNIWSNKIKNFLQINSNTKLQIQESQKTPNRTIAKNTK